MPEKSVLTKMTNYTAHQTITRPRAFDKVNNSTN